MTRSATLTTFLAANPDAIVCELTSVRGSSPRAQGTFMLVGRTDLFGTIGGGALEYMVIEHARRLIASGQAEEALDVPLGPWSVFAYRIGALGYVTDAKAVPADVVKQLRGVDVLVINALFRTEHPTHMSIPEAIDAANAIGAPRTYLTHLTHENFHADLEAELPRGITPAFDGLTVRIE